MSTHMKSILVVLFGIGVILSFFWALHFGGTSGLRGAYASTDVKTLSLGMTYVF